MASLLSTDNKQPEQCQNNLIAKEIAETKLEHQDPNQNRVEY